MNGLDALATAIMWREGPFRPPNRSFRNCNPGNLRSHDWPSHDGDGFDIYGDVIAGYESLWDDLSDKFQAGHNAHGLGPASTLLDLFKVYAPGQDGNDPDSYCVFAAGWISQALGLPISVSSLLGDIWTPPGSGSSAAGLAGPGAR
jgi:hypothetical protein